MQNWNQWQLPAPAVAAPMPPPPTSYAAPGADPMAMMQTYMQYYNQPAPSGYTQEQWASAQQQNWSQWQQWQQQFQQWQAQYGEKYQETMKQLSAQGLSTIANQAPPLPTAQPPPLPKEDTVRPPLPPDNTQYQFTSIPPPHQNNLPLFPSKQSEGYDGSNPPPPTGHPNLSQNPPLPPGQPPLPNQNFQDAASLNAPSGKRSHFESIESGSAKKSRVEDEELTEAEKTFDAQFKQWEEQFNKWKQQNANHPDKTQYKQYEAKWTSWREKLIERREQMRRKRELQKQAAAKAEAEKNRNLGGDKILNMLSSSGNQGLINNLLGIGKTLGLTGKQEIAKPPVPPPLPSASANDPAPEIRPLQQPTMTAVSGMVAPAMTSDMTQAAWAAQQWAAQYNAGVAIPTFAGFQPASMMPAAAVGVQPGQASATNFSQPPPNLGNRGPNFSQPPPGFGSNDSRQMQGPGANQSQGNVQDRSVPPPFVPDADKRDGFGRGSESLVAGNNRFVSEGDRFGSGGDRSGTGDVRFGPGGDRFGRDGQRSDFGTNDHGLSGSQFGSEKDRFGLLSDRFGRDGKESDFSSNNRPGSQFGPGNDRFGSRNDRFGEENDRFGTNDRRDSATDRFGRDGGRFGSNIPASKRLGSENDSFGPGNDRSGPGNDRFGSGSDRFGSSNDRFGLGNDRFGSGNDRFGPSNDRFGPGADRFGSGSDRFGLSADKDFGQKSSLSKDDFGPGKDRFGRNDRFGQSNIDRFESRDQSFLGDGKRDSFGDGSRGASKNSRPFEPSDDIAPELLKLMEKRRIAMDVFKPRDDAFKSDKSSSFGSLSESFKKISGDMPYASRSSGDFGPKGNLGLGPRGPGDFGPRGGPGDFGSRGSSDFGSGGPGSFGPRGPGDFRPRDNPPAQGGAGGGGNAFNLRGPMGSDFGSPRAEFGRPKGEGPFGLRGPGDFELRGRDNQKTERPGDGPDMRQPEGFDQDRDPKRNQGFRKQNESPAQGGSGRQGNYGPPKDFQQNSNPLSQAVPPLERPPWMDAQFPEENSNEKTENANEKQSAEQPKADGALAVAAQPDKASGAQKDVLNAPPSTESSAAQGKIQPENVEADQAKPADSQDKPEADDQNASNQGRNSNVLPFMGENDPKPEDLNMEPPPELPNLGPMTGPPETASPENNVPRRPMDAPFVPKGPPHGHFVPGGPGVGQFGPVGPNAGQFRPGGPNFRFMGPRGPFDGQFGPRGPNFGPFGPRGPMQFGPRGPNDGQFGPRGPNDGQFGPRGPIDGQFRPRGPGDGHFGPRGPSDGQFRPRGPNDGQFGPRGPNDGQFGPRGPNDGQFGPRGPNDGQFGPRGPNNGQFGPRGPNDGQFGPRGPNDGQFGPRGPNDGHFRPRGPNGGQFGPRGPSDGQFGPRGPGDIQFRPRGPNDGQFGPRGPNDGLLGIRPHDVKMGLMASGSFRPSGPEGQFGIRPPNHPPFGPRGPNDGQFRPRGPPDGNFGSRGSDDGSIPSLMGLQFQGPRKFDGPKDTANKGSQDSGPGMGGDHNQPVNQGDSDERRLGASEPDEKATFDQRPSFGQGCPEERTSVQGGLEGEKDERSSSVHGGSGGFGTTPPFAQGGPGGPDSRPPGFDSRPFAQGGPGRPPFMPGRPGGPGLPNAMPPFMKDRPGGPESRAFSRDGPGGPESRPPFARDGPGGPESRQQFPRDGPGGPEARPQFPRDGPGGPESRPQFPRDGPGGPEARPQFPRDGPGGPESRPFPRDGPGGPEPRSPFPRDGPGGPESRPFPRDGSGGPESRSPFPRDGPGGPESRPQFPRDLPGGPESRPFPRDGPAGPESRSPFPRDGPARPESKSPFARDGSRGPDRRPSFGGEPRFDSPRQYDRSRDYDDDYERLLRPPPGQEFCIEKQFNYNHGGTPTDVAISEVIPAKVIDYDHTAQVPDRDYLTPAQCYDYGHGNLKPVVPDHEIYRQNDYRHWEENEEHLKEFDDRMKIYEKEYNWQGRSILRERVWAEKPSPRERDWSREERKSTERDQRSFDREERNRRERDREDRRDRDRARGRDDRDRDREDRDRDRGRDRDRDDRPRRDRSGSRDRNVERGDRNRKDANKEYCKDEERSKGNNSWQECSTKNPNDAPPQDSSASEGKNDSTETAPKKMELPKTPSFTMVDDLLCQPGRQNRPPKIVIILRGPPGSGKSFVAKLIKDKEVEQGGSAPRILSLDDYFLSEKEVETKDDNEKKITVKEMVYEYEEAVEQSYMTSLVKAFKKNITDGFFSFIIVDCINEKITDYEEMWSFAKTKGFQVYVCEMEMDVQVCLKRNIHNRTEDEINRIVDYFEPTPNYHLKLDVNSMLQDEAIEEVHMEDSEPIKEEPAAEINEDSQDSQEETAGVSKWERMEAEDKLDRLDGLAKRKNEGRPQTMEDFLQVPDYYNMEDNSGRKRVRWADLEERKEQEKLRAVGFVVGHTNWDRMMDPTKGQGALTRTKYI